MTEIGICNTEQKKWMLGLSFFWCIWRARAYTHIALSCYVCTWMRNYGASPFTLNITGSWAFNSLHCTNVRLTHAVEKKFSRNAALNLVARFCVCICVFVWVWVSCRHQCWTKKNNQFHGIVGIASISIVSVSY